MISASVVLSVIAGILIAVAVYKYKEHKKLQLDNCRMQSAMNSLRKLMAVNVTLDADSAHPRLIVSEDGKQVKCGDTQTVNEGNNRFIKPLGVVGKEGFSSGCFYYEVRVEGQTVWYLGVTRESADRKASIFPLNGYWTMSLRNGNYRARESSYVFISLSVSPQRVGVFVDYEKGFVSFYDADSMSHIYSYTGQTFNEKLYPFVCLGYQRNKNSTPLIICDDY
nr:erythroid membrane-associated protein-like [Danio rerio]|eukprot:XP_021327494.1 erythroid membrane-associated protein-like [Danio rerio]